MGYRLVVHNRDIYVYVFIYIKDIIDTICLFNFKESDFIEYDKLVSVMLTMNHFNPKNVSPLNDLATFIMYAKQNLINFTY